jgi:uncharacterized protein (TIGR02145 family)
LLRLFSRVEKNKNKMTKKIIYNVVLLAAVFYTSCSNGGSSESSPQNESSKRDESSPQNESSKRDELFTQNQSSKLDELFTQNESSNLDEVTIGNQVWMTKNLNVDKFRNGDPIPQAKTNEEWEAAGKNKQPAWCYYDNDPSNGAKFGKLYNWYAVIDVRGLAHEGYHIPTNEDWTTLVNYLGNDAGTKMKSNRGWNSYTAEGSLTCPNCIDWSAEYRSKVPCHTCKDSRSISVPAKINMGGLRGRDGSFFYIGIYGKWWSSSEYHTIQAWYLALYYTSDDVYRNYGNKEMGLSVRCVRD